MCHCQNSLLVAFPSKFIVSAVEFSVCRNKHFPFYFILIFFFSYPLEMLRNLAKSLSWEALCSHCLHLSWTSVGTEWECVCFEELELSASISAFCCLHPACCTFHCSCPCWIAEAEIPFIVWKWSTVWLPSPGCSQRLFWFFGFFWFCS